MNIKGDKILEENVSESSSNEKIKLNNEDDSEKNDKSFLKAISLLKNFRIFLL